MAKKSRTYKISKVAHWKDKTFEAPVYTTVREAIDAGHFRDEERVMQAANANRAVPINRKARELGNKNPGSAFETFRNELVQFATTYNHGVDSVESGGIRAAAEAVAAKTTVSGDKATIDLSDPATRAMFESLMKSKAGANSAPKAAPKTAATAGK